MSTITKYVVIDADDNEDAWEYDTLDEAKEVAIRYGDCAVIAREYEYSDSSLAWTPDGSDTWPPEEKA